MTGYPGKDVAALQESAMEVSDVRTKMLCSSTAFGGSAGDKIQEREQIKVKACTKQRYHIIYG